MHQVLLEIPGTGLKVYGFGLMLFLALLSSMYLAAWRARKSGLDPEVIYDLAFWVILGGLVGARVFYVVQHGEAIRSPWDAFKIWQGGIVLYGSLIGAGAGMLIYWKLKPFPLWPVLDAIAPAVALGVALGRVGCFLNGCCFGDVCDPSSIPWAVRFPAGTLPWGDQVDQGLIDAAARRSLPVHPTQLYSAIDGLLLCGMLLAYYPLRKRRGEVFAMLLVAYPLSRFLIEQLRGDEGIFAAGMTVSQVMSVGLLAIGLGLWAFLPREAAATRKAEEAVAAG